MFNVDSFSTLSHFPNCSSPSFSTLFDLCVCVFDLVSQIQDDLQIHSDKCLHFCRCIKYVVLCGWHLCLFVQALLMCLCQRAFPYLCVCVCVCKWDLSLNNLQHLSSTWYVCSVQIFDCSNNICLYSTLLKPPLYSAFLYSALLNSILWYTSLLYSVLFYSILLCFSLESTLLSSTLQPTHFCFSLYLLPSVSVLVALLLSHTWATSMVYTSGSDSVIAVLEW